MTHLLLSVLLASLALTVSVGRNGLDYGFLAVSIVPGVLLLIALISEEAVGFGRFGEVTYHFAYDLSYVLLLVGLCLVLSTIIRGRWKTRILVGTFLSAVPIVQLLIVEKI